MISTLLGPLVLLSLVVAAVVFFRHAARAGERLQRERAAVLRGCVRARATVLQVGRVLPMSRHGTSLVRLRLRVAAPGAAPYEVGTEWEVEPLGLVRVRDEQELTVRVDLDAPQRVHPAEGWATLSSRAWLAEAA